MGRPCTGHFLILRLEDHSLRLRCCLPAQLQLHKRDQCPQMIFASSFLLLSAHSGVTVGLDYNPQPTPPLHMNPHHVSAPQPCSIHWQQSCNPSSALWQCIMGHCCARLACHALRYMVFDPVKAIRLTGTDHGMHAHQCLHQHGLSY